MSFVDVITGALTRQWVTVESVQTVSDSLSFCLSVNHTMYTTNHPRHAKQFC